MEESKAEAKVFKKALKGEYEGEKIEIETPKGKIIVGEIDYGDENEAKRRALTQEYNHQTKEFIGKYDVILQREYMILLSILEAPFPITLEELRRTNRKIGQKIEKAYDKLNEVSNKEGE